MSILKKNIICFIPVEVKTRELKARIYLANKLFKKGFDVVIGDRTAMTRIFKFANQPLVYIGLSLNETAVINKLIDSSDKILTVLDEEGGIYQKDWEVLYLRNLKDNLSDVDYILLWGQKQKQKLLDRYGLDYKDKMVVVGNPRFDLFKPLFFDFFRVKTNKPKNFILINTSFGLANNLVSTKFVIENYHKLRKDKADIIQRKKYLYYQKKILKSFLEMIKYLSSELKDIDIVIRPHHAEKLLTYENYFKNDSNVHVIRKGPVQEWIVDAKAVVHHDCTTAIESFLAQKLVYSYQAYFDEELVQDLPIRISESATTKENLAKILKKIITAEKSISEKSRKKNLSEIKEIISNVNFDSAERISSFILNVATSKFSQNKSYGYELKIPLHVKLWHLIYEFYKLYIRKDNVSLANKSKFSSLNENDFLELFNYLQKYDEIIEKPKIKKIMKKLFYIYH